MLEKICWDVIATINSTSLYCYRYWKYNQNIHSLHTQIIHPDQRDWSWSNWECGLQTLTTSNTWWWPESNDHTIGLQNLNLPSHLNATLAIAISKISKGQWWKFELCDTSVTSKAKWWNFKLLAELLIWYPISMIIG